MEQQRNQALLAGMVVFVAGSFAGFGGARLLSSPRASEEAQQGSLAPARTASGGAEGRQGEDELALSLVELRRTMDSLQAVLERALATPTPPAESGRVAVGEVATPGDGSELARSLNALAAALRMLPARGGSSGVEPTLTPPAWVDRRAALATDKLRELLREDASEEVTEAAIREFRSNHLFWTKQDVLTRYGKPDEIYSDEGFVEWCYRNSSPNEDEDVDFSFDDGVVIGVEYNYDWSE